MSAGFRARNQPRLCQPTTRNSGGGRGHGNADGRSAYGSESFLGSTGTKIGDVYNALTSHKYDTLVLRTRPGVVNVRRGRDVSETEWASLDTDRKVKFSPRIGVSEILEGMHLPKVYFWRELCASRTSPSYSHLYLE